MTGYDYDNKFITLDNLDSTNLFYDLMTIMIIEKNHFVSQLFFFIINQ